MIKYSIKVEEVPVNGESFIAWKSAAIKKRIWLGVVVWSSQIPACDYCESLTEAIRAAQLKILRLSSGTGINAWSITIS